MNDRFIKVKIHLLKCLWTSFSENQFRIYVNFNKLVLVDLTILLHCIVVYRSNSSTFKYITGITRV